MKKFFQSKGFIVTSLAVLCVAILGVCWFASRDRTEDFKPEESPPSSTTSDWSDGGTQTDGESGAGAYAPGQSSSPEEEYADVQICEACGMDEALRDAAHTPLPLAEWDAVKSGHLKKSAEKSTCYLVQNCTFSEVFKHTYKPPMQLIERPVSELAYSRSDYDG